MSEWKKLDTSKYSYDETEKEVVITSEKLGSFAVKKPGAGPTPGSKLPVGGRIFYVHEDNGAEYHFYDANNVELTTHTVEGLATAVTYTSDKAEGVADMFYVFDNTSHTTGNKTATNGLVSQIYWGYYDITTGATTDTIGSGKTNTSTILGITDTSEYKDSIFKYIKACNDENLNGCNDWYISSNEEQRKFNAVKSTVGIDWANNKQIWSSVERSSKSAYFWDCNYSTWYYSNKLYADNTYACFAQRSF